MASTSTILNTRFPVAASNLPTFFNFKCMPVYIYIYIYVHCFVKFVCIYISGIYIYVHVEICLLVELLEKGRPAGCVGNINCLAGNDCQLCTQELPCTRCLRRCGYMCQKRRYIAAARFCMHPCLNVRCSSIMSVSHYFMVHILIMNKLLSSACI